MDIFNRLNSKVYNIPKNIPEKSAHKYLNAIEKGYAKYLEAISSCGNLCMLKQFSELVRIFEKEHGYSDKYITKYVSLAVNELKTLGFIDVHYLNKYKYIYLKFPSHALISGDYKNNKRLNKKNELKTDKFLATLTKIEYLINYKKSFSYNTLNEQLLYITKEVLNLIIESGNQYKYDTTTIRRIIELGTYDKIRSIINNTRENNTKLGVIRFIWGQIGKEFWQLGMQGQTISNEPLYFKLNLVPDGRVTIHYAPVIIIFDSFSDLEYYKNQSNKFFHIFFKMKANATQYLKLEYQKTKGFGYSHYNRIGYTVNVIGSNEELLQEKVNILNKPYNENNEHSPLIYPCSFIPVDIDKYFRYSSTDLTTNKEFDVINNKIENIIKKEYSKNNGG